MDVPRLGVESPVGAEPQQYRIRAIPATRTTAHSNAGSLTHWVRPGIKPTSSWILVRFVICWATVETPEPIFFFKELFILSQIILIGRFHTTIWSQLLLTGQKNWGPWAVPLGGATGWCPVSPPRHPSCCLLFLAPSPCSLDPVPVPICTCRHFCFQPLG